MLGAAGMRLLVLGVALVLALSAEVLQGVLCWDIPSVLTARGLAALAVSPSNVSMRTKDLQSLVLGGVLALLQAGAALTVLQQLLALSLPAWPAPSLLLSTGVDAPLLL
jgi:hypothetical protein